MMMMMMMMVMMMIIKVIFDMVVPFQPIMFRSSFYGKICCIV